MALPQRRELVTEIPGPKSRELNERRSLTVAAGVSSLLPVYVEVASGGVIRDVDGNSLIDLGSGIAVTNVGNAAPMVVEAIAAQSEAFTHTCFMVAPYAGYVEVCERLAELTPGDHPKKSALFNSGAEAVENAVKIARAATERQCVVAFEHAYHGRTNLTMALTAKSMPYKRSFGPFAPEIYRVPMSYPYRDSLSGAEAAARALDRIDKEIGFDDVAAIIVEPIQGEGGFIVPAPGFLPAIAQAAKARGIVLIADEIQTGFCRTGTWFACEHEGVVPDLMTLAKGIAGGMPLAAVTGRAEIMDAAHPGGLGGTYGGNPVACAAAIAAMDFMRSENLVERARQIGDVLAARFKELAGAHDFIGDVRGRGAMQALEIVAPGTLKPDPARTKEIASRCHQQGVVVLTAGTYGNVLRLLPPLVIGDELLAEGLEVLADALASSG